MGWLLMLAAVTPLPTLAPMLLDALIDLLAALLVTRPGGSEAAPFLIAPLIKVILDQTFACCQALALRLTLRLMLLLALMREMGGLSRQKRCMRWLGPC